MRTRVHYESLCAMIEAVLRWVGFALTAGCSFQHGFASASNSGSGRPDGPTDSPANCYGTTLQVCLSTPPTASVMLTTQTIDTDTSPLCVAYTSPQVVDACVVAGTAISIAGGNTITGRGSKPLVFASATTITLAGGATIDVASHRSSGAIGAGGDSLSCVAGTPPTQSGGTGGGGYGGSFGGAGGNGNTGASGGIGGIATAATGATTLRGGCPGSTGANGNSSNGAGAIGHGGGAIALLALGTIQIDGTINASGSGGGGGADSSQAGGGGGGSGGMIQLDGAHVTVSGGAMVFANGGGGGEGASGGSPGNGGGESNGPANVGTGGSGGTSSGGDGGNGSVAATPGGSNGNAGGGSSGGGGAGGGGAGVIHALGMTSGTDNTNNVAPPPT